MATIYDVAELAGVSPATVSRVFNGTKVSEDRAERVRAAAERLSFTPNRSARTLRRQRSEVIALIIPDIENPYFTEMARGVEDVAQEAGFSVVLCNSDGQIEKEASYLRIAVSENMAGIVLAPASHDSDAAPFLDRGRPVVVVDRSIRLDLDTVMMANHDAGYAGARELLKAGFQRIACITGPADIQTASERAEGWRQAIAEESGTRVDEGLLRHTSFRVDEAHAAANSMFESPLPPDAILAGNNLIGVGVLRALADRDLVGRVGVAVVGSLPFATLSPRAVTVIRLPAREMGIQAARMLIERITGTEQPARTVVLEAEIQPAEPQNQSASRPTD